MNAFHRDVSILLAQVDRLRAMHRAGLTPAAGEQDALFEAATEVRASLAAVERGMTPPPFSPSVASGASMALEPVSTSPLVVTHLVAACALLDALSVRSH